MKSDLDWSDLKLFLVVARSGGLTPGARLSGVSAPTLGRRIHSLERTLNKALFERHATGYTLTEAGQDLVVRAEEMEAAADGIERWRNRDAAGRTVRISAGTWMTRFLLDNFDALSPGGSDTSLSFVTSDRRLDIPRREADIGIRNHRPEAAGLAGKRVGQVSFAPYRHRNGLKRSFWVGVAHPQTPSARWVWETRGDRIGVEVNSPVSMLILLRQGMGLGVLPCFIGDGEEQLVRDGPTIPELTHEQWLTSHHDDRHDTAVRAARQRISRLIAGNQTLFRGEGR